MLTYHYVKLRLQVKNMLSLQKIVQIKIYNCQPVEFNFMKNWKVGYILRQKVILKNVKIKLSGPQHPLIRNPEALLFFAPNVIH
jgi:hypothetical protein